MTINNQADKLISSIDSALERLDELEQSYNKEKSNLTAAIASATAELGQLADTQALRAQLIRELYWNKKIPVDIISEAFGLSLHRLIKIAGTLRMNFPCANNCGGERNQTFTSRSDKENYIRERTGKKADYLRTRYLCSNCEERERLEREKKETQRKERLRRRDEQLQSMSWDDFVETPEWRRYRNTHLHHYGYHCEVCEASDVSLHIHLTSNSVQGHPSLQSYAFYIKVLCKNCKPRCADLIDLEKGEVVRPEMFDYCENQYHQYTFRDED